MTFTNGDAYLVLHHRMTDFADAIANYAHAYVVGDINERTMLDKVMTYRALFEDTYNLYERFAETCEEIEQFF